MKQWLLTLLTAMGFLTRLRMPQWVPFDPASVAQSARWFPAVGLLVGAIGAALLLLLAPLVGHALAVLLSLVTMMLVTGAFHEDGLADLCDGFWGAWQRQRKLEIMKDSMIGTYGVLALIVAVAFKLTALMQLSTEQAALALLVVHGGSRVVAGWLPRWLDYARSGDNKTPQRTRTLSRCDWVLLTTVGTLPLWWLSAAAAGVLIATWLVTYLLMRQLMKSHIGGYTGDTLGATQQVAEITGLLALCAIYLH
ncbi:adenosylcobinamide-GDP ribazoletransferase [Ferrimonas lipolytica]|uniref:Adenosylcobinamide-GDP ribazoletransferase n=1 Tax=Ferrimonas lipolytica TaxID=2724191 RepID=A0A6H1UEQ0_9GAMM|nr:adenosylcobinamide-GDP ribazoletransferase [Ferrimonas lipolytica]QIZ76272.1 adenosylcobinamide-GDP ribazoletransferase [Ferrimonas lipolytica]